MIAPVLLLLGCVKTAPPPPPPPPLADSVFCPSSDNRSLVALAKRCEDLDPGEVLQLGSARLVCVKGSPGSARAMVSLPGGDRYTVDVSGETGDVAAVQQTTQDGVRAVVYGGQGEVISTLTEYKERTMVIRVDSDGMVASLDQTKGRSQVFVSFWDNGAVNTVYSRDQAGRAQFFYRYSEENETLCQYVDGEYSVQMSQCPSEKWLEQQY